MSGALGTKGVQKDLGSTTQHTTAVNPSLGGDPAGLQQESSVPVSSTNFCLYVGDLAANTSEEELYSLFGSTDAIHSGRIVRDTSTNQSLGYGYINYYTQTAAENALNRLNYSVLNGKPIRLMWADKEAHKQQENNLFVKNLHKSVGHRDLYDTFAIFGVITSCKVATDGAQQSLGYGFVQFKDKQSLEDAIKHFNGREIQGQKLYCAQHVPRTERESKRETYFTNVFVRGLPKVLGNVEIHRFFEQAVGPVTSVHISQDPVGRIFACVNFRNLEDAHSCINKFHLACVNDELETLRWGDEVSQNDADRFAEVAGRSTEVRNPWLGEGEECPETCFVLYAARFQPKSERAEVLAKTVKAGETQGPTTMLYVRGFPLDFSEDQLRCVFEGKGCFTSSVKINRSTEGLSKGTAFVQMSDGNDASSAITQLNDFPVAGSPNKLYVAYLERRDQRTERIRSQLATTHVDRSPRGKSTNFARRTPRTLSSNPSIPESSSLKPIESILAMPVQQRKQYIGDQLYLRMKDLLEKGVPSGGPTPGKVTGMMLEMPEEEVYALLNDEDLLKHKVNEAVEVLQQAGKMPE